MNVLDGVRHLNQSIMEDVSRQFGANGVEIDAHMLCAEDHLPYQGGQYTNEEFEDIQDSLARPFGEWNCRHSWHGIILGVSPPTYTPEQLEEMQRYSTEELTIDGRTKTRYQWTQEMRRCESAIRRQKDTATLARMTGDQPLQRRCQGQIVALNDHYRQLAGKVGVAPEFNRTYVAGFRDAKYTDVLTGNANGGTMASDSDLGWHAITPDSIEKVPQFTEFGSPEINDAVHKACVEILTDLMQDEVGTEEAISIPLSGAQSEKNKGEPGEGTVRIPKLKEPYITVHNHPSNEPLSYQDIDYTGNNDHCVGAVAIGNNGSSAYILLKTDKYDFVEFLKYRLARKYGYISIGSEEEFLKGVEPYGLRYFKRNG